MKKNYQAPKSEKETLLTNITMVEFNVGSAASGTDPLNPVRTE